MLLLDSTVLFVFFDSMKWIVAERLGVLLEATKNSY